MTNGDRLREKCRTNEGLAEIISTYHECDCCINRENFHDCAGEISCEKGIIAWLDQEEGDESMES